MTSHRSACDGAESVTCRKCLLYLLTCPCLCSDRPDSETREVWGLSRCQGSLRAEPLPGKSLRAEPLPGKSEGWAAAREVFEGWAAAREVFGGLAWPWRIRACPWRLQWKGGLIWRTKTEECEITVGLTQGLALLPCVRDLLCLPSLRTWGSVGGGDVEWLWDVECVRGCWKCQRLGRCIWWMEIGNLLCPARIWDFCP